MRQEGGQRVYEMRELGVDRRIIMDSREKGCGCGPDSSGSGYGRVVWPCEHGMKIWVP